MSLNHFPFYPGDYLRDTMALSLEQDGAYRRLIDSYWTNGGPLFSDDKTLARLVRVHVNKWKHLRPFLEGYFENIPPDIPPDTPIGMWRHNRVERELKKARERVASGREGGIKSTEVRQAKPQAKPQAKSKQNFKQKSKQIFPPLPEPESNLNLSTRMPRASPRPLERRASAQGEEKKSRGRPGNGDATIPALDETKLAAYRDQPVHFSPAAKQLFGARVPKET